MARRLVLLAAFTLNASPQSYELYEVKRRWSESSATWTLAATGAPWAAPGARGATDRGSTVLASFAPTPVGARTLTLNAAGLALVQRWVDTPASNLGVLLDDGAATDGADLRSSEYATVALRPRLSVTLAP